MDPAVENPNPRKDETEADELVGQMCRYEIVRKVEEEFIKRIKSFIVKPTPDDYSADWFLTEDYERQQKGQEQTQSFKPFYLPLKISSELNRFMVQAVHGWQAKTLLNGDPRIGSLYHGKDNHKIADYSFEDPASPRIEILVAINDQGEFDETTTLKRVRPFMLAAEEQITKYVDDLNNDNPLKRIELGAEIQRLIQPADISPPKETPLLPPLSTKVGVMKEKELEKVLDSKEIPKQAELKKVA